MIMGPEPPGYEFYDFEIRDYDVLDQLSTCISRILLYHTSINQMGYILEH